MQALTGLQVRVPTNIVSSICDDRGEEPTFNGVNMSTLIQGDNNVGDVIGLLWFKRKLPKYASRFIEMCIMLCADHGPCVSGRPWFSGTQWLTCVLELALPCMIMTCRCLTLTMRKVFSSGFCACCAAASTCTAVAGARTASLCCSKSLAPSRELPHMLQLQLLGFMQVLTTQLSPPVLGRTSCHA